MRRFTRDLCILLIGGILVLVALQAFDTTETGPALPAGEVPAWTVFSNTYAGVTTWCVADHAALPDAPLAVPLVGP